MGFVPIILVFIMVIMLWAILNYNSFVSKKSAADILLSSLNEIREAGKSKVSELNILVDIFDLNPPSIFNENTLFTNDGTEITGSYIKAKDEKAFEKYNALIDDIKSNKQLYNKVERKYLAALLDYNKQITDRPSSWIANIFGFKAMIQP